MAECAPVSILFLGDAQRHEFAAARAGLTQWGVVYDAADEAAAGAALRDGELAPSVIVVAQTYPGQFSHAAIDRLRRLAPVARVIGLMGSWCEGEMRTGTPWPAAVRAYWHQWPARSGRELERLATGQCGVWALPVTAAEEERLLANAPAACPRRQGLIVIDSPTTEMYGWLSAACQGRGLSTVWQRRSQATKTAGAWAGVFDGAFLTGDAVGVRAELAALQRLVAQLQPAPVFALLNFPRSEDQQAALAAGAAAVLSKPLMIDDLFWQMERIQLPSSVSRVG